MQKDYIIIDLEDPREFAVNDFTNHDKEIEEKFVRMYNCPYRNTQFMSLCPYCGESHTKPKSYTGSIVGIKEEKSIGLTLKRRDTFQILESFCIKIAK